MSQHTYTYTDDMDGIVYAAQFEELPQTEAYCRYKLGAEIWCIVHSDRSGQIKKVDWNWHGMRRDEISFYIKL
jgi:hypothetical protein